MPTVAPLKCAGAEVGLLCARRELRMASQPPGFVDQASVLRRAAERRAKTATISTGTVISDGMPASAASNTVATTMVVMTTTAPMTAMTGRFIDNRSMGLEPSPVKL
jgi:hypothetical protein